MQRSCFLATRGAWQRSEERKSALRPLRLRPKSEIWNLKSGIGGFLAITGFRSLSRSSQTRVESWMLWNWIYFTTFPKIFQWWVSSRSLFGVQTATLFILDMSSRRFSSKYTSKQFCCLPYPGCHLSLPLSLLVPSLWLAVALVFGNRILR